MEKLSKKLFENQKFKNQVNKELTLKEKESIRKSVEFVISNKNMIKLFENLSKK